MAKTARLHSRKNVSGRPRRRRPLPSRSRVAVWPHTRTTPAGRTGTDVTHGAPCQLPPSHRAPSGGGGRRKQRDPVPLHGAGRQEEGLAASGTGAHRLGSERGHLPTWGRGALQQPRPSGRSLPLPPEASLTGDQDSRRAQDNTHDGPQQTEGPDRLHRAVDLAKKGNTLNA